jgi:nitrogen-specific signal transduction histidine kinase
MNDGLVITPVPSLVATLLHEERKKGAPLTQHEVEVIRDQAPSIVMTRAQRAAVDEARGYLDIDPESVWESWRSARAAFYARDN